MHWKSIDITFHKNAVTIGLLKWCLCSSIIMCISASTNTNIFTNTILGSTGDSSTPTTGVSSTPTTGVSSTPNTGVSSTPTTGVSSTPNTGVSSTPNTGVSSTPTTGVSSTPATGVSSTPNTGVSSTSTTGVSSTPTTGVSSTPNTGVSSTPTTGVSSTPATGVSSTATTGVSSTPYTGVSSTATTGVSSTPTTGVSSTPYTGVSSTATTGVSSTATTGVSSTATTGVSSTATTGVSSTPTTGVSSTATTGVSSSVKTTSITTKPIASTPSAQITSTTARSDRPSSFPMHTENMDIALQIQVKLTAGTFNASLIDSNSSYYKSLAKSVEEELTLAFNKTPGFANITVTGFWNGSVGVNFTSYYKDADTGDIFNSLVKNVFGSLNQSIFNGTVHNGSIYNELKRFCEQADNCPKDYHCSVDSSQQQLQPICEHLCYQHECQSSGYCVVNSENQATCKCPENDDFVYSGDKCEIKTEKLTMSKDKIIAIATGVGGGVILLLIIAIAIICIRQRQQKRSKEGNIIDNASEQSFQSFKGSEDGIHQPALSSRHGATPGNKHSLYRLPEERAENPHFNPYLSLPNVQQPASRLHDFSQGYPPAAERPRESSRNIKAKSQQFQDRVPNYGDPVQIPRFKIDLHGSDHTKRDNTRQQLPASKTTNARRENPHAGPLHSSEEPKVFDYSNDMELMASGTVHPLNDTGLYDFTYENQINDYPRHGHKVQAYDFPLDNNVNQRNGIKDPYSIKMRLV